MQAALHKSMHALKPIVSKILCFVSVLFIQSFIFYMSYVILTGWMYTLFVCNFCQSLYYVRYVSYDLATQTRTVMILGMFPTLVVKQLHSICTFCLWLRRYVFKILFDTVHALIGFVIIEKTVFEAGKETHISPILLSSEAFWLRAIEVFLAARVTLYKFGCVKLEENRELTRLCVRGGEWSSLRP